LRAAGIDGVTVARLDPGDVPEDEAAARIAQALAGPNTRIGDAFTGRANLYATASGLVRIDKAAIDAINSIHESITVATLPPFDPVREGAMLATIKIIPYAAPDWAVARAETLATRAISVAPFARKRVALISTETPGFKRSLLEKNRQVTEDRVAALGCALVQHTVCAHTVDGVATALPGAKGDIVLIFGATANSDRADVIPAGIVSAGGAVQHVGMPVDPGNLLVLGSLNGAPVVGLPGCARSPKRNGFDFVLERLCADIPVTARDIMGMGVGGLLKEIPVRGQLRDAAPRPAAAAPKIAAIVLAAGRSTRMGANKLLMPVAGAPVLTQTLRALDSAGLTNRLVVTGHDQDAVEAILPAGAARVHNPAFASGMASSLKAGIAALRPDIDAALVVLGDMPAVRPADLGALIAAFGPDDGRGIVVPTYRGKRGHPVLFGRAFWPAILAAEGDQGARQALIDNADSVCEVAIDHPGVAMDADTPEALAALRELMDQ
jgi:molybdenum cofactor cytidylyltransferase